jgi:hypothetical protein
MTTATEIPRSVTVSDHGTFDGVKWFRTFVPDLGYDTFKALPNVVCYKGETYIKMSFNTDIGSVSYKESVAYAVEAIKHLTA